jgi:aryl-alcohol dehydrogenase-like predicted oxidoreductase
VAIVEVVDQLAQAKGCTPGQIALAFVFAAGRDVAPIPGTKHRRYLEENVGALDVELTEEDLAILDKVAPAQGDRYADMSPVNR